MASGPATAIIGSDAQRVLLMLRLLPGSDDVEISFGPMGSDCCTWGLSAGCDCCSSGADREAEREYPYSIYGGLMQLDVYARLVVAGGSAQLQVATVMYGSYIRDKCEDEREAERMSTPAGAHNHYWNRCAIVTIT